MLKPLSSNRAHSGNFGYVTYSCIDQKDHETKKKVIEVNAKKIKPVTIMQNHNHRGGKISTFKPQQESQYSQFVLQKGISTVPIEPVKTPVFAGNSKSISTP